MDTFEKTVDEKVVVLMALDAGASQRARHERSENQKARTEKDNQCAQHAHCVLSHIHENDVKFMQKRLLFSQR